MKNFNTTTFGWRYVQQKDRAVVKKKSQFDFLISIIMAFLIILILSQVLAQIDKAIRSPFSGKVTELNPFTVLQAQAATDEAKKMIMSAQEFNLVKGETISLTVGYQNLSNNIWQQTGKNIVQIKNGSTLGNQIIDAQVKKGWIGYFKINYQAPAKAGTYTETFVLVRNGKEQLAGSKFSIQVRVVKSESELAKKTAAPGVNVVSAQPKQTNTAVNAVVAVNNINEASLITANNILEMVKGTKMDYTVSFKNMGLKAWNQTGSNKVELKRKDTYTLTFKAALSAVASKPGEIGTYKMTLLAPSTSGTYTFTYLLVRNNNEIIKGSQFDLVIKVLNSSQEKSQVQNVVTSTTATNTVVKKEFIAPSNLMEICLSLKNGNYKTSTIDQGFLDGCLKIGINLTTEIAAPVVPTPIASNPQPTVTPVTPTNPVNPPTNSQTGNGPLVRIGLYYTTDPIVISANGSFKIKDQNQSVLASVANSVQATVTYSSGTYTLKVNGNSLATSSYLRFEPDNKAAVMEIASLNWRPAWNTNLNDNKFLGTLEVRYASSTSRLWVINELEMENYLKGLAESSNSSPMEYQKALLTAARTYAMYHYNRGTKHAAENFTLDATYDQVYRGYNSQARMYQVSDAVEQTRGQVVTYNGQVVVTPYFSYSDGRTRNWQEVWGGSAVPWCVSVKEPAGYDKTTMYGHGVGMSARGAILLAAQYNYTFDQILRYYYTGVQIQKIY